MNYLLYPLAFIGAVVLIAFISLWVIVSKAEIKHTTYRKFKRSKYRIVKNDSNE